MTTRTRCVVVALIGLIASALLAVRVLAAYDGDPTIFASFGEQLPAITQYAEERLDREVLARPNLGHDGKYFFVLGNDPFLLDPQENALVIDRPRYRAQRIFYPLVASGLGVLGPDQLLWSLVLVNIVAMGLGTWVVAALAVEMGGSPWWGLAFVLNLGFINEQNIDGAGVVAAALAFSGLLMLVRNRFSWAVALMAASALSREAMLIAAAGSAFWLWRRGRRRAASAMISIPTTIVGLWAIYVRLRLGFGGDGAEIQEIGLPLVGLTDALQLWLADPVDLAAGVAIVGLLLLYTRRTIRAGNLVGWAFVGFVPLMFLFTKQVWANYFDITRAVAPAITAFVLLAFVAGSGQRSNTEQEVL